MDPIKALLAEAKALAEEAIKLVAEGKVAEAEGKNTEAQAKLKAAEAIKAATGIVNMVSQPVMPATLPITPDTPPEPDKDKAIKAVYNLRFGESDAAIKAVLFDLHGADYEAKRWQQQRGFVKYLRTGVADARSEFIWTPETIKLALMEGQDVATMKTVMVEAQDTLGGYLVPEDNRMEIISRMAGLTVVRPRARQLTTTLAAVPLPKMTGGTAGQYRDAVRVTWVDETPTAGTAATNLTLGQERIPVHTVMAETFLSRDLVEDAAFNLVGWLTQSFASAQATDEDNQFLTGDGVGKPQGILPGSANGLSITEVNSGNASTLAWGDETKQGLVGLSYGIDALYRQNAVWIGEKATYNAIARMVDGMGQPYWRERYGTSASEGGAGVTGRLLGYPVLEHEAMPTIATNAYPLLFGDFLGYVVIDRMGMSIERFVDSGTARINQVLYIARRRLGGQLLETWRFAVQKCSA